MILEGLGISGLVLLALWLYAILDAITSDESAVRNLPKTFWIILVIILPDIGAVAWLLLGRPTGKSYRMDSVGTVRGAPTARDQTNSQLSRSDELNARLDQWEAEQAKARKRNELENWEADLRRREAELRDRPEPPSST